MADTDSKPVQRTDDVRGVIENPPAFPDSVAVDHMDGLNFSRHSGMSLRDYFAAAALQGMCSGTIWPDGCDGPEMARRAFRFADAMLAERAEGGR